MLLLRPLRPLLVLLMILMMLLITLMMLSDSHCFWRALVWLFVSIFLIWAVEAKTRDDGYLARLVAHLAKLASWPFISRQGSRVRPFVFMTNLPAMEKTESRVRFVLAQQAKRARLFFTQLRFVRASIWMGQPGDD